MPNSKVTLREAATHALRDLILAGERHRHTVAHRLGLGITETHAISQLVSRGPLGQTELATSIGISTGTATSLVDRMVRDGLVCREAHPRDRRRTVVQLTDQAAAAVDQQHVWLAGAFDTFDEASLASSTELLETLTANVHTHTAIVRAS